MRTKLTPLNSIRVDTDASAGDIAFAWTDREISGRVRKSVQSLGSVSGAQVLDLTQYGAISLTVADALSLDLTGTYTDGKLYASELLITNGGASVISWAAKFYFVGGSAPTLTTAGTDSLILITRDGGVSCLVMVNGLDIG